jgi:hypothetical protein
LIGFEYAKWHGRDAAQHFMTELKALHLQDNQPDPGFSRWRKRLGVLPVQRLVFLQRPLRGAGHNPAIRTVTLSEAATSQRTGGSACPA